MIARSSFLALRRATSWSRWTSSAWTGRVIGMGERSPPVSRISAVTRAWSSRPMNLSSGENPPVASSSRSQTALSVSWIDGRRPARSFSSSLSSGATTRSTRTPPYGATIGCSSEWRFISLFSPGLLQFAARSDQWGQPGSLSRHRHVDSITGRLYVARGAPPQSSP